MSCVAQSFILETIPWHFNLLLVVFFLHQGSCHNVVVIKFFLLASLPKIAFWNFEHFIDMGHRKPQVTSLVCLVSVRDAEDRIWSYFHYLFVWLFITKSAHCHDLNYCPSGFLAHIFQLKEICMYTAVRLWCRKTAQSHSLIPSMSKWGLMKAKLPHNL